MVRFEVGLGRSQVRHRDYHISLLKLLYRMCSRLFWLSAQEVLTLLLLVVVFRLLVFGFLLLCTRL